MIVALSGIDGCGKTTIARRLSRRHSWRYRKQRIGRRTNRIEDIVKKSIGKMHLAIDSPYGSRLADAYFADLIEYRDRYLSKPIEQSNYLFDRWTLCLSAYAKMMRCEALSASAVGIWPVPTITVYLDVQPELAVKRIKAMRPPDWDETLDVLSAYRRAYQEIVQTGGPRLRAVDATRPLEDVIESVEKCIIG